MASPPTWAALAEASRRARALSSHAATVCGCSRATWLSAQAGGDGLGSLATSAAAGRSPASRSSRASRVRSAVKASSGAA